MSFDFKKEYKEFYLPPKKPVIADIPSMNFIAVQGKGNPNDPEGEYQVAMIVLYTLAWTLKMSYKGEYKIDGFFEYKVPPLEGLWWTEVFSSFDPIRKDLLNWTSLIRLPDFIREHDFNWAIIEAQKKKKLDCSKAEFFTYNEGLCVQCMHIGPYDNEPETIARMEAFVTENGYVIDLSKERLHHEIYYGDPRKSKSENLKTVLRFPICKKLE